jgi:cytochrome c oxidase subunit I+III
VHFGQPSDFGVATNQWQQLAWIFQQPQVFAFAIPVLGAIGDIVATSAGARQRNRGFMLVAIGAFGIFSFGAFAQEFFNEDVWEQVLFVSVGLLIVVPTLLLVAGWATTMTASKPVITAASISSLFASLILLLAVAGSALYVIKPLRLHDSAAFQEGMLALVIGWSCWVVTPPPTSGDRRCGVIGATTTSADSSRWLRSPAPCWPVCRLCILGFANRWDGLADAADALNVIAAVGAAVVAISVLVALVNLSSMARGAEAGDDPWGGHTLEWSTSSPPPAGNFAELPTVVSAEPLLDGPLEDDKLADDTEVAS